MKTFLLTFVLCAISCTFISAQGFRRENMPEGSYSPVTNINRNGYPRVLADNSVVFRVNAPQAQHVQIDLGGTKYDMQKGEGGTWMVTTKPQVPGFHYYSLVVDGVSVSDPASQTFYGCSRWSSAIEIKETGMDDFEVQNVPHGQVRTVYYYSKVEEARTVSATIPWSISNMVEVRTIEDGWNRGVQLRSWTTSLPRGRPSL